MMMMTTMTTTIVEDDDDNESLAEIEPMTSLTLAGCQLSDILSPSPSNYFLNSHPSHGCITLQTLILTIHVQMQPVFVVMNIIEAVQEKLNTKWKI